MSILVLFLQFAVILIFGFLVSFPLRWKWHRVIAPILVGIYMYFVVFWLPYILQEFLNYDGKEVANDTLYQVCYWLIVIAAYVLGSWVGWIASKKKYLERNPEEKE